MIEPETIADAFERDGRAWLRGALTPDELERLRQTPAPDDRPGTRVAAHTSLFKSMATAGFTKRLDTLRPGTRLVRLLSFDKRPAANWGVPWHQDRMIAVGERHETPGYANWSLKSGVWHCEPPAALLEAMLFVRVHLDKSTAENGAMEIALGSHRAGKTPAERAAGIASRHKTELTLAEPGDILVLAMLTLHRSPPSASPSPRRTLRADYSSDQLPEPLSWDL